jgi:hypothetical protein
MTKIPLVNKFFIKLSCCGEISAFDNSNSLLIRKRGETYGGQVKAQTRVD